MILTASEISLFSRCQRAWGLKSRLALGLERVTGPSRALRFGTAVHAALSAQVAGRDPLRAFEDAAAENELDYEDQELGRAMVENYFRRWGDAPFANYGVRLIAAEVSFRVPVAPSLSYAGTFDALGLDDRGKAWIIERKTYSRAPDLRYFRMGDQVLGYVWAAKQLFQRNEVGGVIYDGLAKKAPAKEPKLAADGTVAKTQPTNVPSWVVEDYGVRTGQDVSHVVATIKARETGSEVDPFFRRERIHAASVDAARFSERLAAVRRAMFDCEFLPSHRWDGCWDCDVVELCEALEYGDDFEAVRKLYREAEDYGTMTAQRLEPKAIASVEEVQCLLS